MRAALMHTLKVTADHDCFGSGPAAERPTFPPLEILALDTEFPAWSIPTDDDLLKLSRPYAKKTPDAHHDGHARGLVGFCVENRKLRVERRVSVWNTILQQQQDDLNDVPEMTQETAWACDETGFTTVRATDNIALWLMEAASLIPAGMPKDSFTLILDGAPGNDVLSDVFIKYIQRDAAWQMAWQIALERKDGQSKTGEQNLLDDHFMRLRGASCYLYEDFPLVLDEIINNRSKLIQCTFDTGPKIWDVGTELNKYQSLDDEAWDKHRHNHRDMFYWRQLEPSEGFDNVGCKTEILPYKSDDEYLSD
ncbi:hypothetical protein DHEL01_v213060 [Diaporthe helianthi]|uniref:Uncharacterized protein n=1 Tax=Diaporthe helianthi TaxID=158607 RepID=A0A2P5HE62_DIAHE|nr:hypothetical protein DHEL01_v213060 [Diaporthe helianthi]